jgi:hypothetical protein
LPIAGYLVRLELSMMDAPNRFAAFLLKTVGFSYLGLVN